MAAAAFYAIYKKVSLSYILLAGAVLSILIYGFPSLRSSGTWRDNG